jgi:hypothetical protein
MAKKATQSIRIHLGLFFAEAICLSAFIIEISRALSGNTLSWAYVVEWPVLGGYAIYMWRKLLTDESPAPPNPGEKDGVDDARLAEWNDYLTRVHARDQSDQKSP